MDRERLQSKIHPSLIDYPDRQIELSIVFAKVTNIPQFYPPQTAEDKLRVAEQLKPKLFEALALFIEAYSNRERYWENDKLKHLSKCLELDTLNPSPRSFYPRSFYWHWGNDRTKVKIYTHPGAEYPLSLIIYFSKNGIFYLSELVDCTPLSSFLHPSRSLSKSDLKRDLHLANSIYLKMQSINEKI